MTFEEYLSNMKPGYTVDGGSEDHLIMHELSQRALKITMELNNKYHTKEEIVQLMSELTGQKIDESFGMFPPFYTDCGRNIHIGNNVFINAGCKFQDQGGIYIEDIFDVCTRVWGIGIPIKRLTRRYAIAIKWRYGNTWVDLAFICIPLYNETLRGCFTVGEKKKYQKK